MRIVTPLLSFLLCFALFSDASAQFGRGGDGDRGRDRGGDRGGDSGGDRGRDEGRSRFGGGPPGSFGGGPPGSFGGGPPGGFSGGRGGFDPSSFLERLDRNGNGMIDVDEQEGPASFMIQRLQQSDPSIQLGRPVPLSKIKESFERMRGGRGDDNGGGNGGDNDEEGSSAPTELVPGFGGIEMPLPVPGFGVSAELMAVRVTDADTRQAQETINRYDRNKNGLIDQDELSSRWSGNPMDFDQNRDGKLSVSELAVRYARRRVDDEERKNGKDNRSAQRRPSEPSPDALIVKDRFEGKVSYKRGEPKLPAGLPGWFAERDTNNDGQVRMSEYASDWNDDVIAQFYEFDRNFDGVITPEEALLTVEKGPRSSSSSASSSASKSTASSSVPSDIPMDKIDPKMLSYAEKILKRNDKDGSGFLTASEWKDMLMDISGADLNKDGRITPEEYAAYMQYRSKQSGR